jgi:hypothetical protein
MHLEIPCLGIVENLTDVVERSLYSPDPPRGGPVDQSPLAREPRALGSQDPKTPLRARTWWRVESRDPKWLPEVGTRRLLGPRDPKQPLGAETQFWVQDSGWAPEAGTRVPCYPLILLSQPKISILECEPSSQKKLKFSNGFNLFSFKMILFEFIFNLKMSL